MLMAAILGKTPANNLGTGKGHVPDCPEFAHFNSSTCETSQKLPISLESHSVTLGRVQEKLEFSLAWLH